MAILFHISGEFGYHRGVFLKISIVIPCLVVWYGRDTGEVWFIFGGFNSNGPVRMIQMSYVSVPVMLVLVNLNV
jgi:hypothetical protein